MIINYINSTLKQLWKNRFFTVVNLMSLSVAFFIAYIVLAYLLFQFSFDKNHEKRDQIFLVQSYLTDFQKSRMRTSYQLGESITQTFPEVQASTRYFHHFRAKVQHMDEDIRAYNFYAADENIFDFFNIPILHQSSAEGLLADRNNILLSQKISKRYFGEEDPIGKTITVKYNGEKHVFTVKAVFYDLPENSSFQPDYLVNINISLDALRLYNNEKDKNAIKTNWSRRDYYTYLLLNKEADGNHLEKKLKGFIAHRSDSVKNTELKLIPLATLYQDLFMEYEVIIILLILGCWWFL